METNIQMPVTGGFFSTNFLIVVGVTIIFVILYVLFGLVRENKKNDLREFNDEDFVDDDFVNDEKKKQ